MRLYPSSNMGPMLVCSPPDVVLLLPCRLVLFYCVNFLVADGSSELS